MRSELTKRVSKGLRLWVAGCGLAVVSTSVVPSLYGQHDKLASLTAPASRQPAPAFELITEEGKKMHLSDYRGKVVLLNFWATDCGGCVLEIPSFIEIQKFYKDKGFTAVGVAMDVSYEGLKGPGKRWTSSTRTLSAILSASSLPVPRMPPGSSGQGIDRLVDNALG